MRTLCELILNEDFYLQPSIISLLEARSGKSGRLGKNALIATSRNYHAANPSVDTDLA